ncbi:MAG: hypothetical protein U0797_13725 [Gemmataceae bacterium]
MACPAPTFATPGAVERLTFRADGRQLAVNGEIWDGSPAGARTVFRWTPLDAPSPNVGFRGAEVWATGPCTPDRGWGTSPPWHIWRRARSSASPLPGSARRGCRPWPAFSHGCPGAEWWPLDVARISPSPTRAPAPPHLLLPKFDAGHSGRDLRYEYAQTARVQWNSAGDRLLLGVVFGTYDLGDGSGRSESLVLLLWDLRQGRQRLMTPQPLHAFTEFALHPDGARFATAGVEGVRVWDAASAAAPRPLTDQPFDRVAWSRDGRSLLAVGRTAVVFNGDREVRSWPAPKGEWAACALSNDGRWVATGGDDRLLRLRDVATGEGLARWQAHDAAVTAAAFSPDGSLLVTGARDGTFRALEPAVAPRPSWPSSASTGDPYCPRSSRHRDFADLAVAVPCAVARPSLLWCTLDTPPSGACTLTVHPAWNRLLTPPARHDTTPCDPPASCRPPPRPHARPPYKKALADLLNLPASSR